MRKMGLLGAFCLLVINSSNLSAAQIPVIDQSFLIADIGITSSGAIFTTSATAQTFTVGASGILSLIDLELRRSEGLVGDDLSFALRNTSSGIPNAIDAESLFTTTISLASIPTTAFPDPVAVTTIDLSSANIQVNVGDVLAISLIGGGPSGGPPWVLWDEDKTNGGLYSGGEAFFRGAAETPWVPFPNPGDKGFRTWVTPVPIPATVWLFGSGLIGLIGVARRKKA